MFFLFFYWDMLLILVSRVRLNYIIPIKNASVQKPKLCHSKQGILHFKNLGILNCESVREPTELFWLPTLDMFPHA